MNEDYIINKAITKINEAKIAIEDMIRNTDVDPQILPCIKVYVLNSIALPMISNICKGKNVNANRLILKIRKVLNNKIERLNNICQIYKEILSSNPSTVADIGCGLGLNLSITKAYTEGSLLLGVDRNLCFLKVLKKLLPDVETILADASMLPLRSNSVELAFCTAVLHELPNLKVVAELNRVLKTMEVS